MRDGYTYKPFGSGARLDFAVLSREPTKWPPGMRESLRLQIGNIKTYYDEKYDRGILSRTSSLTHPSRRRVYQARELHFNTDVSRVAFLVRIVSTSGVSAFERHPNLFPDKKKDFVFKYSENDIVIIKKSNRNRIKDLEKLARSIVDTLAGEFFTRVTVGIGTVAVGIKDLARSFKEAQISLEVGKVFDTERDHRAL